MNRYLFTVAIAFLAVGRVVAESPFHTEKLVESTHAKKYVIPVPTEDHWEHQTFSKDKKLFAIYFRDGFDEVISIHDAQTGKQLRSITGHGDEVVAFKFSDDGQLLASRCINKHRKGWAVWDVATGQLLIRLKDGKADKKSARDGS